MSSFVFADESFKQAILEQQTKMGGTASWEPWQTRIFNEEVLVYPDRFIKGSRKSEIGLSVEIDLEGIKKHLDFYAAKLLDIPLDKKDPKFLSLVFSERDEEALKSLLNGFLERRGFKPVSINLGHGNQQKKMLDWVEKNKSTGGILLEVNKIPAEELDPAHADEVRYRVVEFFTVRSALLKEYFYKSQFEVGDEESLQEPLFHLMAQTFLDLSSKMNLANNKRPSESPSTLSDFTVEIQGSLDFKLLTQLTLQLQNKFMRDKVEKHKVSRGEVVFLIRDCKSLEDAKQNLAQIIVDTKKLVLLETLEKNIRLELK